MTREENEVKRAEIYAQLRKLNQKYIADNTTIEPGSYQNTRIS